MSVNTFTAIVECSERTAFTSGNTVELFRYLFNVLIYCMLAGDLTLVLDFGRFVLDSDSSAAKLTTAEEASHYLFFRLIGRNISAHLVDGHFDWDVLTGGYTESDLIRQGTPIQALYSDNEWLWPEKYLKSCCCDIVGHGTVLPTQPISKILGINSC